MKEFIGKNPNFKAIWNCDEQCYKIYYKGMFMIRKFKFSEVKTYLN